MTVVAAVRCGSDGLKLPDRHDPAFIDVLGGDLQSGVVGRPLTDTLMVRITDSDHLPIQFQPVRFKLLAGGSAAVLIPDTAITDADGQARSKWVLGQIAGQQTVEARVISTNPASAGLNHPFHATAAADVADTVVAVKGNGQQGIVGTALSDSLAVAVTDKFGNPISGQTVNWSVPAGQGSVSASNTTTGPDGRAAVLRILGPTAGTQTTTATWPGHTPVVFTAQSGASGVTRIVKLFGDNQTAPAGQKLTDSIVVQAQDFNGNGVAGESIGWTVASGGGSLSAASATTNAQGKAFVFWTLGNTAGPNTVKALRIGVPEVQFAATGNPSQATHIVANSSQTLSGTAGLTVTPPPSVRVLDALNNGVQGVTVTFTVTLGGGTVSDGTSNSATVTVATNVTGTATLTSWTLGPVAGSNNNIVTATVTPTLTGSPATFTATAVAGQPGRLAFIQQPTSVGAGAVITPAVTVQVQDIAGNPVGGTTLVTVAFGNNPGSALLGGTKSVNAVNGIATFNTLTVDKVGIGYTLVTTGSGLLNGTSTAFNVTTGTPFKLVFVQQPTSAGAAAVIAPPITVQVQDANNNPITTSVASIAMAIGTNPGASTLSGTTPVAAVGGLATFSNLSLNKAGAGYTLVASSGTLQPATSTAFNIGAGVATQLVITTQPSNTPAGTVITPAVQVAIRDAQGNTITTDTRTISFTIGTNPSGGTLSGTLSVAAVAGVATFSNLNINFTGIGYTLVADDGAAGLGTVTSASFNIVVGSNQKLGFIVQPSTVVTGAPITPAVQVAVQDMGGNTVPTATNAITVFLAGGTGLAGTQTVTAVAGVATFTGLNVTQAGASRSLSASSPTLIGATSNGFTINPASTITTITTDLPDPSAVGQAYAVNYTVAAVAPGSGTPTGNVTISDGVSTCTASVAAGTCNLTSISTGAKTLTGTYTGDANYTASVSAGVAHTVNAAATTTTITGDAPDPSVVGQPYAITVTVSSAGGTPTGTVTVSEGVATCPITLAAGTGSCNLTSTTAGAKTITATYAAQGNFFGSSGTMGHQVNQAATTTTVGVDTPDPSAVGQVYAVPYTVAVTAPGVGTPTGNVTVSDGAVSCTGSVAAATCNLTSTTAGVKTLTATYSGDANFATSAGTAPHTVNGATTTTTITADPTDPSVTGQAYPITVTVTSTGGTPTGSVTVSDGAATCPITLAAGTGTCNLTSTTAGAKTLTATYAGSGNFSASTSAGMAHQVNAAATTTTITADTPDPSVVNAAYTVSFTVAANAPGGGTPAGNVTVSDGAATCVGTVAAGNCNITSTTTGAKTLTATYAGNANYLASPASAGAPHQVDASGTTVAITQDTPDPSVTGQAVTVNFTVTGAPPAPGGSVTVSDGAVSCVGTLTSVPPTSATGTCSLTFTSAGTRSLTATYGGDGTHGVSTSPASVHGVNQAATVTTITAHTPDPSVVGNPIAMTVSVVASAPGAGTPTGTILVSDGSATCLASVAAPTCNLITISAGPKTLTAQYVGDANFTTSTSVGVAHTVTASATTTTVMTDLPEPSVPGQLVTVAFQVSSAFTTATGSVNVTDGTRNCSGTLAAGSGSCTVTYPGAGSWPLTATYAGDANHATSTSVANSHLVSSGGTTTSIGAISPASTAVGAPYTVPFTVVPVAPSTGTPTGNVTVSDGTGVTCMALVAAGNCVLTSTTAGSKTVTAVYAGDANFTTSTSAGVSHVVGAAATTTTISSDPTDPSVVGQDYVVGVSVVSAGGTPTGTVNLADGTGATCVVTLAAGIGSCTLNSASAGAKTLTATYVGTANFSGSSGTSAHQVNASLTTTTIGTVTPSSSAVGAAYTVNYSVVATLPGTGTPTGNVTVSDGTGGTCTATVAVGNCALTSTTVGTKTLTAAYAVSTNYAASTSAGVTHVVTAAATTTTITNDTPDPTAVGQAYAVTVSVVSQTTGTPTGTVTVSDGTGATCPITLPAASCNLTSTSSGTKNLTAVYATDGNFAGSTSAGVAHVVNLNGTSTAVSSSANPSTFGQGVSFTATVTSGAGTPAGTVQFKVDGGNLGGAVALNGSGQATSSTTTSMAVGNRVITAEYSGNASFATSTGTLSGGQVVGLSGTATAVSSSANPSTFGQGVSFTATVTSGGGTPAGTVQFRVDGVALGAAVALNGSGQATSASTTSLAVGNRVITAEYGGNASFATSTGTLSGGQVVGLSGTATAVSSSANPSTFGQGVSFTATVSSAGGTPAGTVQFKVDAVNLGAAVALNGSGQASSAITTSLAVGNRVITAEYSGNASFAASTGTLAGGQTVTQAPTSTSVTSSTSGASVFGQPVSFTATVSSTAGTPGGTVQFLIDGSPFGLPVTLSGGIAVSGSTSALAVAGHAVTTTHAASGNFLGSSGTLSGGQTVSKANSNVTVSGPGATVVGQSYNVTFGASAVAPGTGVPTGTVDVNDGQGGMCSASLATGNCNITSTVAGSLTLTAVYGGDGNFIGDNGTTTHQVNPASTTTTIISHDDGLVAGSEITITFTVVAIAPGSGTPVGNVAVDDGVGGSCTAAVAAGSCSFIPASAAGTITLTATYDGNANFNTSNDTAPHTVN